MLLTLATMVAACLAEPAAPAPKSVERPAVSAELRTQTRQAVRNAAAFYRKHQNNDGSFAEGDYGPAITGLALTGMLTAGSMSPADPMIAKGLAYLEKFAQDDGGVYTPGSGLRNYTTCIALLAFAAANKEGRYQSVIDKAAAFLKNEQWDASEGVGQDNPKFGGAGYGKKSRPDMSNTAFLLEALTAANVPKDDPAFQRAIVFLRRCQNYSGEGGNDLPQGAKINDGGFYYTAAEEYNPGKGTIAQGLRSYGSMTYAGLKSFIHAGLEKNDPRVEAAMSWIRKNYSLEQNPGLGQEGLFYYFHTFAKALDAAGVEVLETADGAKHNWREEYLKAVLAKQRSDGSWANDNKRWLEDDPRLVTAYVLMGLAHANR